MKEELTKYMTIGLTNSGKCGVQVSPDLDCSTAFQLVGTLALHILNAYADVASKELSAQASNSVLDSIPRKHATKGLSKDELQASIQGIKESMYDAMDSVFSSVLTQFLPDSPRSDIEDEAIMELVNSKIEQRYNALSDTEKALYKRSYESVKRSIASQREQSKPTSNEVTESKED